MNVCTNKIKNSVLVLKSVVLLHLTSWFNIVNLLGNRGKIILFMVYHYAGA